MVFINRVAAHPLLKNSEDLRRFLTAPEDEWAREMAYARAEEGGKARGFLESVKNMADKADKYLSGR
jgi:hypothetical protein